MEPCVGEGLLDLEARQRRCPRVRGAPGIRVREIPDVRDVRRAAQGVGGEEEQGPGLQTLKPDANLQVPKDAEEAKSTVRKLIDLYPKDEKSWLEGMRVYAEIRDQEGMRRLLKRIQEEKVDFTAAGREHLSFFRGLQA